MVLTKAFTALRRNDKESAHSVLLERRDKPESLLFESGVVAELAPWETETIKKEYTKVCDAYGCLGVLRLSMREDDSYMYLVLVTSCRSIGKINNSEMSCINSTVFLPLGNYDDACILEVQKLLNSGSFYFTTLSEKTNDSETPLDLSLTYQRQCTADEPDNRFFWNHSLHVHLQKFGVNCSHWLLNAMCGGIEVKTVYAGAKQAKAMVISRLSCERAGTRFNVRGVNDDGHVANFVETEQIIVLDDCVSSFVQTRGSVPVFWEQPGVQVGSHKVKLSRGFEASAPAFSRHISSLKMIYGDQIMINLLGRKEGESYLSKSYQDHLKASEHCHNTPLFLFDYHLLCKGGKKDKLEILRKKIDPYLNAFGFFVRKGDEIISQQSGTLRTNCVDCLDRTNALQSYIGLEVLPQQLAHLGLAEKTSLVSRFLECFKTMWASNGHLVSRTYTGTGSMEGGARFGSKLHDGAVSVRRTIRNNFFDGSKQEAIDILLLGNTFVGELGDRARALLQNKFLHASPLILRELCDRHLEYTKWRSVRVCVGTFNVNGGHHFRSIAYKHQSLDDWLLDFHLRQPAGVVQSGTDFAIPTDIFAIGFEELVDLKAGNIISTNAAQRIDWGNELKKVISRDNSYVLLTSEQLVGVCLYVFVRADMVHDIRDVAVDSVKTGLGGSAGNKGGVAIRFLLHSSSLCFICSHFAAGQSNIVDRNNDYHDIVNKVEFPMGRTVIPHDYVFWCGDFNYRIDLPMDVVKGAIKQEDWDELQAQDQLTKNRKENKCFRGFSEGRLSFAPTYKYDPFSDDYDTSEKMRVPAWTDRVLWRRRHPRSKHVTSLVRTEDLLVDVGDGGVLAEDSSDSEDEEDGRQNGIVEETATRIPDRRKSYRIRQDIANWSAGKLLYYHSAQLKTSDHRPVIALIEIEIQSLDREKEASVHDDVITAMGPADPTVVVSSVTEGEEINSEALLTAFENIGSVVLVRVIDEEFLITFDDGRSALTALSLNDTEIDSVQINVKLKSESLLSNTDITVGNLVEGGASHFVQAPSADPDRPRTLSGRPRTLSDLLDSSEQASTHTTLEPIIIHSVEGASDDDLDDDDAESSDENEHEGNGNYSRATMISPPPRPKPPPPFKPKKPANPNRNAHPSSPNALKPLRPDRTKDNFGEEGTVDSSAAIEDQDRLKVGESESKKSPIEKRKLAPSRPGRPASSGGKSPTAEEQLKPQVPHRKVESRPPARRPGRPPPPKAGPEKPPPPSLKKPVTSPPPFVAKPPSERAESEDTSTTTTTTNSHHGRSSPTLPTPVTKPEHHVAESTKVKDNSAMSLRKRLGTLKIARKQKEPRPPGTLSIGTPFDVKHVGHVGADNVQSLLVTTSPIDIVGGNTGAHASSADDGESPPTTTPLHGLDRPVDDLSQREDDAVVHRKAPVAPKRDPVVPKRNPVVPPREPPVPTRKPEHVPVATDEQIGSGSSDPEVPKMDPIVPNRDPVVAPREPPVPARKPEHVQIVHGKEPTSLGAVPQTDHRVPKMDPDVLKKAPVLPKRDPVVPPRDPLVPGPKHGPVAPPRHHGAVTMDTAVSIERTSPMNSHPVAAPRRRSGNEDHAQTEPANTSTFNPAVFADRVPPQLPPRVPRPDQADNELDTEPGLSSELTVHGPPQVPPRFDLNDDDSDDFPVPPPRRKGRR